MSLLLLLGAFEAFFLILLVIGKRKKNKSDSYLATYLGIYGLTLAVSYIVIYNYNHHFPFPNVMSMEWLLLYLHGPFLLFYVKSLTRPAFKFQVRQLLHFIPFIAAVIIYYYLSSKLPLNERMLLFRNDSVMQMPYYIPFVLSVGASMVIYNLAALKLIKAYNKVLKDHYSKTVHLDLNWLRTLIVASLLCYAGNVLLYNLNTFFEFFDYKTLILIAYSWGTLIIIFLGYYGLQQGHVFTAHALINNQARDQEFFLYDHSRIQEDENDQFIEKLLSCMNNDKPYLKPEISLAELSNLLAVRPEYLSRELNSRLKQNFYDFINRYRIEEFKMRRSLPENRNLSVLGLASECGFNSKASFYRAYKKFGKSSPKDS